MIFSGFLMYGSAQKNKAIGYLSLAVLFIYLFLTAPSLPFFAINMGVITALSFVLKKINLQILSGASILIYSAAIDTICFYFFPVFPINVSLGTYIASGIAFNLRSALPAVALSFFVQIAIIVAPKIYSLRRTGKVITE